MVLPFSGGKISNETNVFVAWAIWSVIFISMLMETKINAKCKKTLFVLKRGVMVNGEWSMVKVRSSWCRCWSFHQQPKLTVSLPVANSILFQRFACWSKDQHGLKMWMVNGQSSAILFFLDYYANSPSTLSVIHYQLSIFQFTIHPMQLVPIAKLIYGATVMEQLAIPGV